MSSVACIVVSFDKITYLTLPSVRDLLAEGLFQVVCVSVSVAVSVPVSAGDGRGKISKLRFVPVSGKLVRTAVPPSMLA
jgi:hypothetical protein